MNRTISGWRTAVAALVASAVTAAMLVGITPAATAAGKPPVKAAKDLPPLPATAPPKAQPEAVKGDFSNPPVNPDDVGAIRQPTKSAFDPAKSKLVDSETTPTKLTYANPDGTRTDVLTQQPTRFKDAKGAWVDTDLALAPAPNGALRAKAADKSPTAAAKADGVTSIDVAGGTIELRHRDAAPVPATLDKGAATYAKALGRRDLRVTLVSGGIEEFVVLPDAGAGASYVTEVTLPPGFAARDAKGGVEFLDGAGTVVATMNNGWANDAHQAIEALTPVTVHLLAPTTAPAVDAAPAISPITVPTTVAATPIAPTTTTKAPPATTAGATTTTAGATTTTSRATTTTSTSKAPTTTTPPAPKSTTVRVEAGIDPGWLADPARVFPVTIDPSTTAPVASPSRDTMVFNGANANANLATYPELWVAVGGTSDLVRSYLYFDLPAGVAGSWVNSATLGLTATATNCSAGSPPPLAVGSPRAAWSESTLTWNTQANLSNPIDPNNGTTTPTPPCAVGATSVDATWLVWKWAKAVEPNYGIVLTDANESSFTPARSRQFASANAAIGRPTLTISYGTGSSAPEAPAVGPDDGAVISTTTPTLTVAKVTDPDGDPVKYWFRGTPGPDPETGAWVIDTGWIVPGDPAFPGCPSGATPATCAYTVPPGLLHDGVSYSWHAWTYDSNSDFVKASWVRTVTVNLHLGADALPTDAYGPVQVNLASGNLATGVPTPTFAAVGGPVGLGLAYNSAAPATTAGLVGSYYPWDGATIPASTAVPTMSRTDPTLDFEWIGTPPSPVLAGTNYFVRWEGNVTVPTAGDYRFGGSAKDGVRIWIDDALVVDRWEGQFSWVTPAYSAPIAFTAAARTKKIKVEYYKGDGTGAYGNSSLLHLVVLSPGQSSASLEPNVPASWLSHADGPLPTGWTLSPAGAGVASARLSDQAVTLTDPSGSADTYWSAATKGFAPLKDNDAVVAADANGQLALHGGAGSTTTFDPWGDVATVSSPTDDGNASALGYTWSGPGVPKRLMSITDPYASRSATLHYAGRDTCPTPPSGFAAPPADMLCQAAWPDATTTDLFYVAGQLARVVNPGGATTDLGYDPTGRLATVRTPLQGDALGATGLTGANATTGRTDIAYGTDGRVQAITLAEPTPGAPRPGHTYVYTATTGGGSEAVVHANGLTEPNGSFLRHDWSTDPMPITSTKTGTAPWVFARLGTPTSRTVTSTDADGVPTTAVTDWGANPNTNTLTAGGHSTQTLLDGLLHTLSSVLWPGTTTPDETVGHDGGATPWVGLAATWWSNATLSAQPAAHSAPTGPDLMAGRPASLPTAFSGRLTGTVSVASGTPTLGLQLAGYGRLYVDDKLVVDAWSPHAASTTVPGMTGTFISAGPHRIRVDYASTSATTPTLTITSSGSAPSLAPRYSDTTSHTVAARTTAIAYDSVGGLATPITMAAALPTKTTQGTGAGALVGTAAYDSYGRVTTTAQPNGATTARDYYGPTDGPLTNDCGVVGTQAGALRSVTGPDPTTGAATGAAARRSEFVYDAAGRARGSQVVGGGGWSCTTYDTRGRVATRSFPAWDASGARTVTYNYAVGTNPLVMSVADPVGTITTTVDLLGRTVAAADVWGQTTTATYDQPGRLITTKGPRGRTDTDPTPAGRPAKQYWNDDPSPTATKSAVVLADARYLTTTLDMGKLAGVVYANGTQAPASGDLAYDAMGRATKAEWAKTAGAVLATDEVTYSRDAKVTDQKVDGVDAAVGADNFTYDSFGRLTDAKIPTQHLTYDYGPVAGCAVTDAGANTNRSTTSLNGGTPITYCYDKADRLISTTDPAAATITYDARGNTKVLGAQTMSWDGADRHTGTSATNGGTVTTVTYRRDATDRIVERTEGSSTVRYGYTGAGDSGSFTMNTSNGLIDRHLGLAGGVLLTRTATAQTWDYPNIHGDVVVTADGTGTQVGAKRAYDPFGQALTGLPDNSSGNFDYGWLGSAERPIEHAAGMATIEMGVRPYVPSLGRFLSVDPVAGGSCNDYDYVCGDPVNRSDLYGQSPAAPANGREWMTVDEGSYSYGKWGASLLSPIFIPIGDAIVVGVARFRNRNRYHTITQVGRRVTPDGIEYSKRHVRIREEMVQITIESISDIPGIPEYTGPMTYDDLTGFGSATVTDEKFLGRTSYGCTPRQPCIVAPWN